MTRFPWSLPENRNRYIVKNLKIWGFCPLLLAVINLQGSAQEISRDHPPNFIIIFADDPGYGDLGSYGHPTIRTPNLDEMAQEGMRFTQFYVAANISTPGRAGLLIGQLPVRYGLTGGAEVFFLFSSGGLPNTETTIAKALRTKGYRTGIIGKWHHGHLPPFLPSNHGFDYSFWIPYSNDMIPEFGKFNLPMPLSRNNEVLEEGVNQDSVTIRYTSEAFCFIEQNKSRPFFLYYASNFPHVHLHASEKFRGISRQGLYGNVVQELDWSIGEIFKKLSELGLDENTLVVFTSDNGPWLQKKQVGGSAGLLYEGKGSAYEGGMRVPVIFRWKDTMKPGQICSVLTTTLDLFPTLMELANINIPDDRIYDGVDLTPVLANRKKAVKDVVFFYNRSDLYVIRKGPWKAYFATILSYSPEKPVVHDIPLLYNLEHDLSERFDLSADYPEIVEMMREEYKNTNHA